MPIVRNCPCITRPAGQALRPFRFGPSPDREQSGTRFRAARKARRSPPPPARNGRWREESQNPSYPGAALRRWPSGVTLCPAVPSCHFVIEPPDSSSAQPVDVTFLRRLLRGVGVVPRPPYIGRRPAGGPLAGGDACSGNRCFRACAHTPSAQAGHAPCSARSPSRKSPATIGRHHLVGWPRDRI